MVDGGYEATTRGRQRVGLRPTDRGRAEGEAAFARGLRAESEADALGFLNAPAPTSEAKQKKRGTHAAKRASDALKVTLNASKKLSRAKGTPTDKKAAAGDAKAGAGANGTTDGKKRSLKSKSPAGGRKGKKAKAKLERQSTIAVTEKEARAFIAKTEPNRTLTDLASNPLTTAPAAAPAKK